MQLERKTGQAGKGQTIAQFLMRLGGRYDHRTGAYRVTGEPSRCSDYKTVIIDECSSPQYSVQNTGKVPSSMAVNHTAV